MASNLGKRCTRLPGAREIARDTAAARRKAERREGAWHPRRFTAPNSDNRPSLATPSRLWVN